MNGRAPAYNSKAMIAIVSYIAWLSRGTQIGAAQPASDRYIEPLPARAPSLAHGASLYLEKCMHCHGAGGARPSWNVSAALGRPLVQRRRRYGARRPHDRFRPIQHAARCTRHADARSGIRRSRIRFDPPAAALSKKRARPRAAASGEVLLELTRRAGGDTRRRPSAFKDIRWTLLWNRTLVGVTLPEMGESVTEGSIVEWRKNVGDYVAEGDAARRSDDR